MKVRLEAGRAGTYLLASEEGDLLFESDWDFPRLASAFGWTLCSCGETDGTVDCPHRKVSDMIEEAHDYLDGAVGSTIEDPGYFD